MTHYSSVPLWDNHTIEKALHVKPTQPFIAYNVCTDTRLLKTNDLFVAIKGDFYDGHAFLEQARQKGASACLIQEDYIEPSSFPAIKVKDTLKALEQLGQWNMQESGAVRIGVTGSVGKTSTKEIIASALSMYGKTHATQGNLNNHYGLPLTMARMKRDARYGVFEMGMSQSGELTQLSQLLAPHIAIITSVEPAHLAYFSSVKAIADAKAEIMVGMGKDGLLILSRDIFYYEYLREQAINNYNIKNIISVGLHEDSDIRLVKHTTTSRGGDIFVKMQGETSHYALSMQGIHQAHNSLFALAVMQALDVPKKKGLEALEALKGIKGRGEVKKVKIPHTIKEFLLIDDSYNANPASMNAALVMLGSLKKEAKKGRTLAVLGDMKELGENSVLYHRNLKDAICENTIDYVLTVGTDMKELAQNLPEDVFFAHADRVDDIIPPLLSLLQKDDLLLVKGSFSMRMNRIISHLTGLTY